MTWSEVLTFSLVASLLVMSPGPNGVLIAKTVPTSGRAAGFANIAGFVAAFYGHGILSVLGISVLLVQSALAFSVVKFLGAAYLFWIGARALLAAWRDIETAPKITPSRTKRTLWKAFGEGVLTNGLNPKVSMFYLAAFPQFFFGWGRISRLCFHAGDVTCHTQCGVVLCDGVAFCAPHRNREKRRLSTRAESGDRRGLCRIFRQTGHAAGQFIEVSSNRSPTSSQRPFPQS